MICIHCHKEIPTDSAFCCYCGAAIKGQEMPSVSNKVSTDETLDEVFTWGTHLNWAMSRPTPKKPKWLQGFQSQYWVETGVVVWDETAKKVIRLHAAQALDVLSELQSNDAWKANGIVLGEPAAILYLPLENDSKTDEEAEGCSESKSIVIGTNQIQLSSAQTLELFRFLNERKNTLTELAEFEQREHARVLADVYRLILSWKNKNPSTTK